MEKPTAKFAGAVTQLAKGLINGVGADQDYIGDLLGYATLLQRCGHTVIIDTMTGAEMEEVHLGCIPGIYLACP